MRNPFRRNSAGPLANGVPLIPEPIGNNALARLAQYNRMEYSGGPGGGYPHFGMKGEECNTFTGWAAIPQALQGQIQMGKTTGVSVQDYPALPGDNPPPAIVSWLPDWTAGINEGNPG